jgi:hypothetical protein
MPDHVYHWRVDVGCPTGLKVATPDPTCQCEKSWNLDGRCKILDAEMLDTGFLETERQKSLVFDRKF